MTLTPSSRRILVALAWPYASGPRHIGHVAGFGVPADIFARYHRLRGDQVLMVSGTDEHGTPILVAADKEQTTPREIADRYNLQIGDDLRALGLTYDLFTRTTTENHYKVVQDMFLALHEKGYLKLEKAMGAFSSVSGRTLPDRYIEGTCPICGFDDARGDQCENCGNQLDPQDLKNARSRIDGQPPVFRETEHFFFDLAAFREPLTQWLATRTHWRPNVIAFSQNFVNDLRARPITRDLDWGVPIPLEGWRERDDKRIYVWFDAVMGYLSASIEWARVIAGRSEDWKLWWEDPDSQHYYFMGKDNITFHTVMWPAILLGYGGLDLPHEVVASEFLTMEGKKLSSSRGGAIYVNDFLSRYEPDPLRYFVTVAGPENQDTDFTWAEFVRRNNDELVNNWGNLVNRVMSFTHRNFGEVPPAGELNARDREVLAEISGGFDTVGSLIERASFQAAIKEAMRLSSLANVYLAEQEPWKVIKVNRERAATILNVALRLIAGLNVIFAPVLPFSAQRVHEMLGYSGYLAGPIDIREVVEDGGATHRVLAGDYSEWVGAWQPPELAAGQRLGEPRALFRQLDPAVVIPAELERMGVVSS